jgi:hypothetical protein
MKVMVERKPGFIPDVTSALRCRRPGVVVETAEALSVICPYGGQPPE